MSVDRDTEPPTHNLSPLLRKGLATVTACAVAQCLFVLWIRSSISPAYKLLFEGKRLPNAADFFSNHGAWVLAAAVALGVASIGVLFAFPTHRAAVRVTVCSAILVMTAALVAFFALTLPILSILPFVKQD